MTFDKLVLTLFTPDELVLWLDGLDRALIDQIQVTQTPTALAFAVRRLLERHGWLTQQRTWDTLAEVRPNRFDEICAVAKTFGIVPINPGKDETEASGTASRPWTEAKSQAVRAAVESKDFKELGKLLDELLASWLSGRTDELDPSVVRSLKDEVAARLGGGADLEAVWGDVRYKPIEWLETALQRSRCVARIGRDAQSGLGTGFRFPGEWLGAAWADTRLVLTNAHVVSPSAEVRAEWGKKGYTVLAPDEAYLTFFGLQGTSVAEGRVTRCLWTSPPDALDATLLQVDFPLEQVPLPPRYEGASLKDVQRINVIGHPKGGAKQLSLQDNQVQHEKNTETRLFYRSPSDGGSSGSPLFDNERWTVVGIHHAAEHSSKVNRGIPLAAILAALREEDTAAPPKSEGGGSTERVEADAMGYERQSGASAHSVGGGADVLPDGDWREERHDGRVRESNDSESSKDHGWKDDLKLALRKCLAEPVPEEVLEALRKRFDQSSMAIAELIDASVEWIDDPDATLTGRVNEIAMLPKLVESELHKRLCRRFGRMLIAAHPLFRRFSSRYDVGAKDVCTVERGFHPMLAQFIIAHAHTAEPAFVKLSSTVFLGRGELPGTEIEVGPGPEGTKKLVASAFHTLAVAEGKPVELNDDLYRWVTSAFNNRPQGRSPPHDQYEVLREQLNKELGERRHAFEDEIRFGTEPEIYPAYCVFLSDRNRAPRYDRMARALKAMLPGLIVFRFEYDATDIDAAAVDALRRLFKDP